MKEQENRLLRCIGDIDEPLIMEAETRRMPRKHWGGVLALAACAAVIVAVSGLWGQDASKQLQENVVVEETQQQAQSDPAEEEAQQQTQVSVDTDEPAEIQTEAPNEISILPELEECIVAAADEWILGGFSLGMTLEQAGVKTDENWCWAHDGLTVHIDPFSKTICQITVSGSSSATLANGLKIGSTAQEVAQVYPTAQDEDGEYTSHDGLGQTMCITVENGYVTGLALRTHTDCLLSALTSATLDIYTKEEGRLWHRVPVTTKAAKRICGIFTISEFEPLEGAVSPSVDVWIDFGGGAAASVNREYEYVVIWSYTGDCLDLSRTDELIQVTDGVVSGIDGPLTQALADPTEIWDTMPIEPKTETS